MSDVKKPSDEETIKVLKAMLSETQILLFKLYVHTKNTREKNATAYTVPSKIESEVLKWLKLNRVM